MRQETIKGYSPNFYPKKGIEKESKLSPSLKKLIASVAILGVLGTLTYIGVKSMGSKEVNLGAPENPVEEQIPATVPQEQNVDSSTAEQNAELQTEAVEVAEKLPTVEDIEITDLELMNNPEELVKIYDEKLVTEWMNAGATPENAKLASDNWYKGIPNAETAKQVAAKYDNLYIEAMVTKKLGDKQWRHDLSDWVGKMKEIHANTLLMYFLTTDLDNISPEDKEPYQRGVKIDEIVSVRDFSTFDKNNLEEGDKIEIEVKQHDYDNSDKNRVGKEWNDGVTGQENTPKKSFVVETNADGKKTIKMYDLVY